MVTATRLLPEGFEALEPFVGEWAGLDEGALVRKRISGDIEQNRAFYDAGQPLFAKILEHMKHRPIGSLDASEKNLLDLAIGLMEISTSFEFYHGTPPAFLYDVSDIYRDVRQELPR